MNRSHTPQHPSVALLNPVQQAPMVNMNNGANAPTVTGSSVRNNGGFSMRDVLPPPSSSFSSSSSVFSPSAVPFIPVPMNPTYNVPVNNDTINTLSPSASQTSLNSNDTSNEVSSDTHPGQGTVSATTPSPVLSPPIPVISSLTSANGTVTVQAVYHGNAALQQQQQQHQITPNPFHSPS